MTLTTISRPPYTLASLLLLATSLLASVAPQAAETPDSALPPVVSVATAAMGELAAKTHVSGTLAAKQEILINPQINGYGIQQIKVEVGDKVAAGDTLIVLDDKTLAAQLAQADADTVRAKAGIRQAETQIDSAQANLTQANATLKRNQRLRSSGSIPAASLEDSQAAAEVARANFESTQEGLTVAKAQLTQLTAQRQVAALNLARATLKAPADGIIAKRAAKLGAIASAGGEPLLTLIANGEVELQAEVVETALSGIKPGNQADIAVAGLGMKPGKVRLISPTIDPQTRLGLVYVTLESNPNIRVGGFAEGWITTTEKTALVIPSSAVESTADGSIVTVVKDGVIEKRPVIAGILSGEQREIIKGLAQGEQVLVRAGSFFRTGDKVRVAE